MGWSFGSQCVIPHACKLKTGAARDWMATLARATTPQRRTPLNESDDHASQDRALRSCALAHLLPTRSTWHHRGPSRATHRDLGCTNRLHPNGIYVEVDLAPAQLIGFWGEVAIWEARLKKGLVQLPAHCRGRDGVSNVVLREVEGMRTGRGSW